MQFIPKLCAAVTPNSSGIETLKILLSSFMMVASLSASAQVSPVTFQSTERQTALLELYTSEGCSSCPPAEVWLSGLKKSPGLWKEFVPLAFHVDYWDYLGWRDPWSNGQFSDRQRNYAQLWRSESVYTPGFVLNGKEWHSWSWRKSVPVSDAKPGVLTVSSSGTNRWQVSFTPTKPGPASYEVHGALMASELSSDIKAGENRGRRLIHDFVVMALVESTLSAKDGRFQGRLALFAKPATGSRLALAVWVTQPDQMQPLQAAGGWLD